MIRLILFFLLCDIAVAADSERAKTTTLRALNKTETIEKLRDKTEDKVAKQLGTSKQGAAILGVGAAAAVTGCVDTESIKGGWKYDNLTIRPDLEKDLRRDRTTAKISFIWGF